MGRGGIPWQSKGCSTCKKRRIKCDQGVPECHRCIKRGIQCPGYEKRGVFIYYDASAGNRPFPLAYTGGQIESTSQVQYAHYPLAHMQAVVPLKTVPSGPMIRVKLLSEYLDGYFPTERAWSNVDMWQYLLHEFVRLPNKSEMLEKALSAITCLYLGQTSRDDRMSKHGLQLYNSAIRHMSIMISRDAFTDDIVYTAVLFQEIESSFCPNGLQPWLAHISGMNTILKHYFHRAGNNPLIGRIYQRYQKLRMIQSSSGRGLLPDEYKFLTETSDGSPFCELLRIFAELSPIVTKLQTIDPSDYNSCQDLLRHSLRIKDRFFTWYSDHRLADGISETSKSESESEFKSSSPGSEFISSETPDAKHIRMFGTPSRFQNFDYVLLHLYYWAALSLLYPAIFNIKKLVSKHPKANIPGEIASEALPLLDPLQNEEHLEATRCADKVCRTMQYCARDYMKMAGYHMTMFPLCMASGVYIDSANLEKFTWCVEFVGKAGERGHETARHVVDISWYAWRVKTERKPLIAVSLREVVPERESAKRLGSESSRLQVKT